MLTIALIYFLFGLGLFFIPVELLRISEQESSPFSVWTIQLLGAALLGLGWMNYLNKTASIGGIYGRPLVLQNLMFAFPSFIFSVKSWMAHPDQTLFLVSSIIFGLAAATFTMRFFGKGPITGQSQS